MDSVEFPADGKLRSLNGVKARRGLRYGASSSIAAAQVAAAIAGSMIKTSPPTPVTKISPDKVADKVSPPTINQANEETFRPIEKENSTEEARQSNETIDVEQKTKNTKVMTVETSAGSVELEVEEMEEDDSTKDDVFEETVPEVKYFYPELKDSDFSLASIIKELVPRNL